MATEYYQIPSSQGLLSLEASSSALTSSVLSSSGAFPSSISQLSASTIPTASDPWLGASTSIKTMSLDDWGSLKKSNPPSLFEPEDIESRTWENIIPQQTPEVLKASFELKNSYELKNPRISTNRFLNNSSKIDAWSSLDPSVTISSPSLKGSNNSLKKSTQSMQDDDENSLIRYKTELCKSFTETGVCRYGVKCQFAHGKEEVRPVLRHPKYKTEICKTFHNTGTCPYGIRCRFIHTRTKEEHQVFSSSTSSFVDSDFENEDNENEDGAKMTPPPGIPVPQWSKSWTPTASPVIRGKPLRGSSKLVQA